MDDDGNPMLYSSHVSNAKALEVLQSQDRPAIMFYVDGRDICNPRCYDLWDGEEMRGRHVAGVLRKE